ncbi:hypothetical protein BSL78_00470 [Apostichopus japonicus]|uniref:Uncharacterized protein n=1 Tax=Stichopus japonicus TaxID=307972 RepID=A0A2G8LQS5_STIJA|nr:hypothetical protein BSL78_00470 [Apostichopus japonicus]
MASSDRTVVHYFYRSKMPSFSQCIVQTCATATRKMHCQRRGFQRLCGLVTVVILICTFYLFKDKDQHQITLKDTTPNRSIIEAQSKAITTASLYRTTDREALVVEHLLNVSTLSHHGEEEEKEEEEEEEEARRECQPGHNVIMIKTHKSGSSTLQNILLRMAENNHLRVALPKEGVYLNDFQRFQRDVIYLVTE